MPVASDHLPNVRFAHFDFKDQLAPLLYLCHQNIFRCFDKLLDDKFEESLHRHYWTGAAGASGVAAAFFRAFKIMLATVELG